MKRVATLEEMRVMEYRILEYLDKICRENNIRYYLTYGTLLGAVRHQGFIPWDDDIDVIMFRSDYERFREAVEKNPNDFYKVKDVENDDDFSLPFPKICDVRTAITRERYRKCKSFGVYVDIFLLDNIPDDLKLRSKQFKWINLTRIMWEMCQVKNFGRKSNPIKVLIKFFIRLFPPSFFAKWMNRVARKYNGIPCKDVGQLLSNDHKCRDGILPPSVWGEGKLLRFEKGEFIAPSEYDVFLRDWYGDYMQLPPPEQRVPKHDVNAVFDDEEIKL